MTLLVVIVLGCIDTNNSNASSLDVSVWTNSSLAFLKLHKKRKEGISRVGYQN